MFEQTEPDAQCSAELTQNLDVPLSGGDVPCEAFDLQLSACRRQVLLQCTSQPAPYPAYTLFFSVADGTHRAHVVHACADDLAAAWSAGVTKLHGWVVQHRLDAPVVRVDWVEGVRAVSWERFNAQLELTRRNHFRMGLALDSDFACAFTEQELNAYGMLDDGPDLGHAALHAGHFRRYARARFGGARTLVLPPVGPVYLLSMRGAFCAGDGVVHLLASSGLDAGRRSLALDADTLQALVEHGSDHLARRIGADGVFGNGELACFGEREPAPPPEAVGPLLALVEVWELTHDPELREAIERVVRHMTEVLIRPYYLPNGLSMAFPVERGNQVSLGGTATCLRALLRYGEASGNRRWLPLLEQLAMGIVWLQEPSSGRFDHVLCADDLSLRASSQMDLRDGEAVYALLRLYAFSGDQRWLQTAENAFDHFVATDRWTLHEPWLAASVSELVRWRPREKYFRFGVENVAGHLDFVLDCNTTCPALLELMLGAQHMLVLMDEEPGLHHLLQSLDRAKFDEALAYRANYQRNGFFWPEIAMYFEHPASVEGAFFVRHRGFQVEVDEIGRSLCALLGYRRCLVESSRCASSRLSAATAVAPTVHATSQIPLLPVVAASLVSVQSHRSPAVRPGDSLSV